ncbi:MAG: von Willebrand factor type A domain-containing protein [Polyangiaceae bacterium]|nr:von Willebrand factor type A domain-containing protein [Polyangiaceae bacterium]
MRTNLGSLPQKESVRLEEYVNSFKYGYVAPATDSAVPFSVSVAAAPNLFERGTVLMRVGIQGKNPPPESKKPANIVFLVDTSGSMQSADKLPLVQQVLSETVGILAPTDTISVVSYAGDTSVRLGPTPVSQAQAITNTINGLTSAGSTAGAAGIDLAYQQAQAGFIPGGINHVVLCTDGDFNVGPFSTAELVKLIEEKRKTGVTLTVLGFGVGNLNDALMESVSNAGNGIYGVISNPEQATSYVTQRMLSTLVHIAKDVKIQVEFNANAVFAYRLLGYENRAIADANFRNDIIDAGEIGAGHQVTALYELVLAGGMLPNVSGAPAAEDGAAHTGAAEVAASDLALIKLRYKQPGANETDPALEVNSSLAAAGVGASYLDLDSDFQWAAAISAYAEILKQSPYADKAALATIESIVMHQGMMGAPDKAEFARLFGTAKSLMAQ